VSFLEAKDWGGEGRRSRLKIIAASDKGLILPRMRYQKAKRIDEKKKRPLDFWAPKLEQLENSRPSEISPLLQRGKGRNIAKHKNKRGKNEELEGSLIDIPDLGGIHPISITPYMKASAVRRL